MNAIDLLMNEHRHIQRVLDVLDRAIAYGRGGGSVPMVLFERAARFLITYVDGSHGAKEGELFRAMTAQGLPTGEGVLAAMSAQHELGREQATELLELARSVHRGEAEPEVVYSSAERYVRMHRGHTEVEEGTLFPMARRLLSPDALERVRARFARIEGSHGPLSDAADVVELAFPAQGGRTAGGGRNTPGSGSGR